VDEGKIIEKKVILLVKKGPIADVFLLLAICTLVIIDLTSSFINCQRGNSQSVEMGTQTVNIIFQLCGNHLSLKTGEVVGHNDCFL
jgi:hypothetical protein